MQAPTSQFRGLRDYTNIPFEIFIVALSILPFLALAYFYADLPQRIPLFLNLSGDVASWAEKSALSVFRVPLMAVDTQLICLVMKYGTVNAGRNAPRDIDKEKAEYRYKYIVLSAGLWDWFRCLVAIKMSAASLDTIFLSFGRFNFLARPAFLITAIAAGLSIAVALFYGYRLLIVKREINHKFGSTLSQQPIHARRVYWRAIYFSPTDSTLFVEKYLFNFGNKWVWALVLCLIAYPVLVFS